MPRVSDSEYEAFKAWRAEREADEDQSGESPDAFLRLEPEEQVAYFEEISDPEQRSAAYNRLLSSDKVMGNEVRQVVEAFERAEEGPAEARGMVTDPEERRQFLAELDAAKDSQEGREVLARWGQLAE